MIKVRLLVLLLITLPGAFNYAQVNDSRLNLFFSIKAGDPVGEILIENQGIYTPSLFTNFESWRAIEAKALYRVNRFVSAGAGVSRYRGWFWNDHVYEHYDGVYLYQNIITPTLRLHSGFRPREFKVDPIVFIEAAPVFAYTTTRLRTPVTEIYVDGKSNPPTLQAKEWSHGVRAVAGVEVIVSNRHGFTISYSFDHLWMNGILYNDKSLGRHVIELGVFFRGLYFGGEL